MIPKKLTYFRYLQGKIFRFVDRYVWRFALKMKLKPYLAGISKKENDWWDREYIHAFHHHSFQNKTISRDFINEAKRNATFSNLFSKSTCFAELWSWTGELSHFLSKSFSFENICGFEVAETAVWIANELYGNARLKYRSITVTDQLDQYGKFDFAICSNTLEHFKNPFAIIEKAFNLSDILIVIVPYNQPPSLDYEYEGWPDHVFRFDEFSFPDYDTLDFFIFRTGGWQVSSAWEEALEMAIILKK